MATVKIVQRPTPHHDGTLPIYLRLTMNRKSKFINLGYSCKKGQWNAIKGQFKKNVENHVKKNIILNDFKNKALKIIDQYLENNKVLTFNEFEVLFRGEQKTKHLDFFQFFKERIDAMAKAKKTGNQKVYEETYKSFRKFVKVSKPSFEDITYILLEKYENHLRGNGGTNGGISIKMRTIRAVFNNAITKELVTTDHYPFTKYKISKLKGKSVKKALTREEVRKIESLDLKAYPTLINARHFFVFSYYTRGMNFVDMMYLRWKTNVFGDKITYTRSKTKHNFIVKILPPVQEILDYYKTILPETGYVFPILLKENLTPQQIQDRKKKVLKRYNKNLKEIAKIVGIDKPLTSYVARHSIATNMKQAGVETSIISQSLGHQNPQITETYLKEFENEVIDDAMEKLL